MGMGKTIQTISLLLSDGKGPNLVVAPTVSYNRDRLPKTRFLKKKKIGGYRPMET